MCGVKQGAYFCAMKYAMKFVGQLLLLLSLSVAAPAQTVQRPKLVVGMVVDQMRWDYLYRFSNRYGNDGFKRVLKEGFNCENTFIPYTPTYTAAGHACVYTGTTPALNGIMGNSWYSKALNRTVYCAEDYSVQTVGSTSAAGKMSPVNMQSNTITDEVRMAQNFQNKTISVAIKDRGAILPGGHTANGAYWFDNAIAGFISSTFYMTDLPPWVKTFNARRLPDVYLREPWNTLYPINTYTQSTADDKGYENNLSGEDFTFPHVIDTTKANRYDFFKHLPAANTYTFEMAKAAIAGESLGKRSGVTDFLAISLSATDYLGHATGPNSVEVEDMYLRLDRDLAQFLKHLDATVGKGQYLLFITADHGVAHIPAFATEHKMPGGAFDDGVIRRNLNASFLKELEAPNVIASIINYQIYLNDSVISARKIDKAWIKSRIIDSLLKYPAIAHAFDAQQMASATLPQPVRERIINGYNQKLSGDIQFLFKPQWFDGGSRGATHGVWNPYDAHIPLLFFGWNIKPGKTHREVYMSDIAPTLGALLQVQMPNATTGKVIEEVVQ